MQSVLATCRRALIVLAAAILAPPLHAAVLPDLIFVNGEIETPSGRQQAVAVSGTSFVAVGSDAAIRKLAAPGSRIIDLQHQVVMPGLYDMHVHPVMAGNGAEGRCRFPQDAGASLLLATLAKCVAAEKPGAWITAAQWTAAAMGSTPITRATLDAVSPNNPVMLYDVSGHSLWVNSRALAAAEITRDTENPEGGIIERDAAGEPTGLLRESANDLIFRRLPPPTPAQNAAGLRSSVAKLTSMGIVGFTDAMVYEPDLIAYTTLVDSGMLPQTVRTCIAYSQAGKRVTGFEALLARRGTYARSNVRPDCVKIFVDGVPTESHTSAMLEPYASGQPNAPARGLLLVPAVELNAAVARFDKMGLTVLFHAAGDAATRAAFDAIAYARKTNGMTGPRHQIGHSTFIAAADIPRAKAMNATIEFSPYLWYPTPINDDIIKAIGPERIARVWPLREGIDAGGLVVAGSDWAVVPEPDPWLAIETSITRRAPGGAGSAFGPGEALTLKQAIAMFTVNGARQMGVEAERGTIAPGKRADFIVIDKNPFRIPASDIHTIKVQQSWIDGRQVFDRAKPAAK
jgi:predicted amidohydrolase YtcJ